MRTFVVATLTVAAVALTGGCSGAGSSSGPEDSRTSESPNDSASPDPQSPAPRSGGAVIDSEACAEVRSGIDAFNLGDFEETVAHFVEAVPLAEEQDDGSVPAGLLVEAVRYYAELDAELYPEASQTSPDFAKYKAITLGQCLSGDGDASESPGVEI